MSLMAHRTTSNTIVALVGALVAILVVVAVVFALQPPTQFDPNTPEGTAQGYFQAVNDDDMALAESYLTEVLRDECRREWWFHEENASNRVVITATEITGDTAKVDVRISVSYGERPFEGGTNDEEETMTMVRQGDTWAISEPVWPMDPYACGEGDR